MPNSNKEKSKGFSGSFGGGKGGGGGSSQTPVSGRSTSTAYILGAVSEGVVEGPIDGIKNVYLDEVPIQNQNGSYNFQGSEFYFREGSQSQSIIDFNTGGTIFPPTLTGFPNYNNTPQIFTYNNPNIPISNLFFEVILQAFTPNRFYIIIHNVIIRVFPGIKFRLSYTFNQDESGWIPFWEEVIGGNDFASSIRNQSYNLGGEYDESSFFLVTSSTKRTPHITFSSLTTFVKVKIEKLPLNNEVRNIETFRGTAYDYGYTLYDYYVYQPLPVDNENPNPAILAMNSENNGKYFQVNLNLNKYWATTAGFNRQVALEIPVQVEVKNNLEITRQFTNLSIRSIKVKLSFALQRFDDEGNVFGERVDFRIQVKQPGGNFETRVDSFFEGRYPNPTEADFTIPVTTPTNPNNAVFQVRIIKDSGNSNDPKVSRQINWVSYTQIIFTALNYPNTAIAGFKFNAEYFSQIPTVAIKLAGRRIRIPSNATIQSDRRLTYSGNWTGNFITPAMACGDPAWILYDLLTNTRYGLGNYIDTTQIDKWSLYEMSRYCNELVPNGSGGVEPRFQANIALEGKVEAYQVIQNLVSIFRGFAYWQSGVISFAVDKPGAVIHQFTQADVEEGSFTYSRSGLKTKKTVAVVSWLNPADFYKKSVEVVEDPVGIQKWGIRELELEAIACTSRGQARRAGVAALLTNRVEQESVTFRARAFAAYVKPGDLIRVYDSKRESARYAGIVKAATATTITLDSPVNLPSGTNYTISVTTSSLVIPVPDGVDSGVSNSDPSQRQRVRFDLKDATIQSRGNNLTVLTLNSPGFGATVPPPESNWVIRANTIPNTIYRVINRSPVQDSIEGMHEILAVEYSGSKYSFIDDMQFPVS